MIPSCPFKPLCYTGHMIPSKEYSQLNKMFKDTFKETLKEELKIAWETYSKNFQEFVIDHIQKLYDGQERQETNFRTMNLDIDSIKVDLGVVRADVSKLKADIKRIDIRIKTRKKYD